MYLLREDQACAITGLAYPCGLDSGLVLAAYNDPACVHLSLANSSLRQARVGACYDYRLGIKCVGKKTKSRRVLLGDATTYY